MSKGEPIKLSTIHFVFFPNHLILPKMVELVNAWGWGRVWQSKIQIKEVIRFWKMFFLIWEK